MFLLSQDLVMLLLLYLGGYFTFWIIHMDSTVQILHIIMEDNYINLLVQCK